MYIWWCYGHLTGVSSTARSCRNRTGRQWRCCQQACKNPRLRPSNAFVAGLWACCW